MAFIVSANSDTNYFYMPGKIILRDQKIKKISLGAGRHLCPGGNLARKSTARLIELFGEFEKKIKIAHVEDKWTNSFGFRFLKRLPVEVIGKEKIA